jgi:hypothetical protein
MLPEFIVINTSCNMNDEQHLTFSQRKLLNKNPYVRCNLECNKGSYSFNFDNGIFGVNHTCSDREELFLRIKGFREAFQHLECDLHETNLLQEEMMEEDRVERAKKGGYLRRYNRRLESSNREKLYSNGR